jgi:hypothetical protein
MQAIKTKALVKAKGQLSLLDSSLNLEQGNIVEVIILYQKPKAAKSNWQNILASIGTYTEEELSGFAEARKEFDRWQPTEF